MRIVSLLPAATELACALGLEAQIVGISFECDYPASITDRPRVVSTAIDTHRMTPRQIDDAVSAHMRSSKSLYVINESLLARLRPDIILTQDLCQVCAPSGNELSQALAALDYQPEVIFMSPHTLADIESNLLTLAEATGRTQAAMALIADWHGRIDAVKKRVAARKHKPRAMVMEWVEPIYCAGHWLAEMIELAGGDDRFARKGADSVRIEWTDIIASQPEVIVLAPCGYNKEQAKTQLPYLTALPGWNALPAVRHGQIYPVDANAYLVRPGPRIIEGIEMLEGLFANAGIHAAKAG